MTLSLGHATAADFVEDADWEMDSCADANANVDVHARATAAMRRDVSFVILYFPILYSVVVLVKGCWMRCVGDVDIGEKEI